MLKSTQFTALNTQISDLVDTSVSLVNASIEHYKQVAFLQCEAARALILESTNTFKNLCNVTSAKEVAEHVKSFAANSVETGIAKGEQILNVFNNSKTVFADAASSTVKNVQESLAKSVDQISAVSPEFSKVASDSLQSWISSSKQAVDTVSKVTAQVTEVASKNLKAATEATLKTVKKATTAQ